MNKKLIIVAALGAGLIFSSASASAIKSVQEDRSIKAQERVLNLQKKMEELKLKNCERVSSKLQDKVVIYEKNKTNHLDSFTKAYQRVVDLADDIEADGYDVTQIRLDLATLDGMIKRFEADYLLYIETVKDSQSFSCGETEPAFKIKLNQSRNQLGSLKDQAVAIRTYWAQTMKPNIRTIQGQIEIEDSVNIEAEGTN